VDALAGSDDPREAAARTALDRLQAEQHTALTSYGALLAQGLLCCCPCQVVGTHESRHTDPSSMETARVLESIQARATTIAAATAGLEMMRREREREHAAAVARLRAAEDRVAAASSKCVSYRMLGAMWRR
jgi:hypothetical protein